MRVGVIGLGVGEQHIVGYAADPRVEVAAICDINEERLRAVGSRNPGICISMEPEQLLTDPSIDVVSIASYDDAHGAQVLQALRHGKHVFVEKPLCLREDEAVAIRAALQARPELRLTANFVLRCSPRFLAVRALVQGGSLGRLFNMEGDYLYGRLHKLTEGWRGRIGDYSVTLGGAVHMIDLLQWISGDRVVEVHAMGNRIASAETGSAFRHADIVNALLRFESGCVGKVCANFGCVMPHSHHVRLFGTQGTVLNVPDGAAVLRSRDASESPEILSMPVGPVHKGAGIGAFLDGIESEGRAFVTEAEVFSTMSVCFAIDRSVRSGRTEEVIPL